MAEQTMKQVYRTYESQQPDGTFYAVGFFPASMTVMWPFTDTPIPDALKTKVAWYNWDQARWEDKGIDPVQGQLKTLADNIKTTAGAAQTAGEAATTADGKATDASAQAAAAQQALLELSDLVLSKDTGTTTEGGTGK